MTGTETSTKPGIVNAAIPGNQVPKLCALVRGAEGQTAMEITLHHDRNWKSFKRHFPGAKFLGFECGYWGPCFRVDDQEWKKNKAKLPKSCTIDKVEPDGS